MAGGFPKLGVPFEGVPISNKDNRIIAFWGVYWVPLILGSTGLFVPKPFQSMDPLPAARVSAPPSAKAPPFSPTYGKPRQASQKPGFRM